MEGYYDIDAILAEDERVPVEFQTRANNLGYLDPTAGEEDLEIHSKVELPLWLAASLSRRNFVEAKMPSRYASNMRNALNADPSPNTVRLRSRSPHYFELGLMLASIVKPTDYELPQLLRKSLAIRYRTIFDTSVNSRNEDTTKHTQHLTDLERRMFTRGYEAAASMTQWSRREMSRLVMSEVYRLVARKRRRG